MYQTLKNRIVGTPLEPLARALVRIVRRRAPQDTVAELNRLYDSQAESVMQRVLEPTSNCVDVGCHEGSIVDLMLQSAPDGEIHAFEPLPHLFAVLAEKYASSKRIHLYRAALSDTPGTATFNHVVASPALSGLRARYYGESPGPIEKITVEVQRFTQDAQAEVQELQQNLQGEFQQRLEPVLQLVAAEMGLQFIFNGPDAGLVWADAALDISSEVIKKLDSAKPVTAKPAAPTKPPGR